MINLFIVPYQASKGLTGQGDELPVLGFASFYVMNWTGSNGNQSDHCPDTTFDHDHDASTPQITLPNPPRGRDLGRLRRDRRLRARSRRPDRNLRRGPAHAVPRVPRPLIPERP